MKMIIKIYELKWKTIVFIIKIELNSLEKEKIISWENILVKAISRLLNKDENENEKVIENIKNLFVLRVSAEYEKK